MICDKCGRMGIPRANMTMYGNQFVCDTCLEPPPEPQPVKEGGQFEEGMEFVLVTVKNTPDGWDNYSGHWQCGYNQCVGRISELLESYRKAQQRK